MHVITCSCIFPHKNKNNRTFEAQGTENFKNIEPRPKCTGSYKKTSVCDRQNFAVSIFIDKII